ncbi:uncharacterized protein [Spinacia oleracea]|uniref:Reverse transcriptase zinc-binding domain-containing protein n=1 Tax=Spinacia oleracea TaxID=3562 RepID=A0ABM3QQL1_SPIOL|nr:uncharacterized protein LOC130461530 [Spinacia oleracea]
MYESMSGTNARVVGWSNLVWNRLSVPKHRFVLWLAMLDRLKTKGSLHKMGIGNDNLCVICRCSEEINFSSPFFECAYGTKCISVIMDWLVTPLSTISKSATDCKGSFKKKVVDTAITALAYSIWRARNVVVWELKPSEKTYADIEAAYRCLVERYGVKEEDVILYG